MRRILLAVFAVVFAATLAAPLAAQGAPPHSSAVGFVEAIFTTL